jgi:hypothetical protein
VFLGRRPVEPVDEEQRAFYQRLLGATRTPALRDGEWRLCERHGWPDNPSWQNLLAWCWAGQGERVLITVNLSDRPAQARVQVPWQDLGGGTWHLRDVLSGEDIDRGGDELRDEGLYVALAPWGFHFLRLGP